MQGYQFFALVASTLSSATTSLLKSTSLNEMLSDFSSFNHFKNTVANEGINRPMLIGFDTNGYLRQAVPTLGAIERLDYVTAGKDDYRNRRIQGALAVYTTKAIEALNGSLDDTISQFKSTLENFKSTADEFEEKLESAACKAENVPDGASTQSAYINAMHRRDAMDLLNSFAQAIGIITIPAFKDISTESAAQYNEQFSQVSNILGDKFGISYDGERFTSDDGKVAEEFKPTEGSASDKDYDLEALVLCLRACRNVIDGLEKLCDHSEDVYTGLASAKEDVDPTNFTGDTSNATPALEEGETHKADSTAYVLASNFIWVASFLIGKCLTTCTHFMDISQRILEAVGNPDAGTDETRISSPVMMTTTQAPTDGVVPQTTGDTVMADNENAIPTNGEAKDAEGKTVQSQVAPDVEEGEATVKDLVDTAEMFASFEDDTNVTINITPEGSEGGAEGGAAASDLGSGDPNVTQSDDGTEGGDNSAAA